MARHFPPMHGRASELSWCPAGRFPVGGQATFQIRIRKIKSCSVIILSNTLIGVDVHPEVSRMLWDKKMQICQMAYRTL